jgi:phosphatidylinositol glycan class N
MLDLAATKEDNEQKRVLFLVAEKQSRALMEVALRASAYFQKCVPVRLSVIEERLTVFSRRYDWFLLQSIVTTGYITFILLSIHLIVSPSSTPSGVPVRSRAAEIARIFAKFNGILPGMLAYRFFLEKAPWSYYLYLFFPYIFSQYILHDADPLINLARRSFSPSPSSSLPKTALYAALTLLSLFATAFGYTDRRAFAVIAFGMGWLWPALMLEGGWKSANGKLLWVWKGAMTALAVFPLLPVEKGENLWVVCGFFLCFASTREADISLSSPYEKHRGSGCTHRACSRRPSNARQERLANLVANSSFPSSRGPSPFLFLLLSRTFADEVAVSKIVLTISALAITASSATSLQKKQGLPQLNQYAGWANLSAFTAFSSLSPLTFCCRSHRLVPPSHPRPPLLPASPRTPLRPPPRLLTSFHHPLPFI